MATPAEVERTLHDLVRRLDDASVDGRSLPERRTLVVHVHDHDEFYSAVFGGGRITGLARSAVQDADVRIVVGSDDLVALATGRMGVAGAMLTGRLRVNAGMRDLLLIRQLF